jgi:hypothetical protein
MKEEGDAFQHDTQKWFEIQRRKKEHSSPGYKQPAAKARPIKVKSIQEERPTAEIIQFPANRIVRRIVHGVPADDMFAKYDNGSFGWVAAGFRVKPGPDGTCVA